jgi:glucoamylase
MAVAEQLYDALYVWKQAGSITVTATSLAFFKDFSSSVTAGTYASTSATYTTLYNAIDSYAEGFLNNVATYAASNGSLSEQYDRSSGTPLSARDLTWSYAALLTVVARRAGIVPDSWVESNTAATSLPGSCAATSVVGSYTSATNTAFPAGQTPGTGVPTSTATTKPTTTATATTTTATATSTACATATVVAVTFNELKTTTFGQTVKIVGNIAALGSWDTSSAVALSASQYSLATPEWSGTISLPAGQAIQYKYIVVNTDGSVTWEADPNHTYTVPATCATTAIKTDTWQT